jgi:hypothetical protein
MFSFVHARNRQRQNTQDPHDFTEIAASAYSLKHNSCDVVGSMRRVMIDGRISYPHNPQYRLINVGCVPDID